MAKSNRRSFLAKAPALAVATVGASAAAVSAKDKTAKAPAAAPAPEKPVKKVLWKDGKAPEKQALFSPAVSYATHNRPLVSHAAEAWNSASVDAAIGTSGPSCPLSSARAYTL